MPDNEITFDDQQLLHYSRQIMLPHFGIEGQHKLQQAHVVIIGMGGLGSPAAMYLAASGIGSLTLVDFDTVEDSNLQRQIVHNTASIGKSKVDSASETLLSINPETIIHRIDRKLDLDGLCSCIAGTSCIIDASDNFETRFLINRASISQRVPLVSAAAIQYEGQICVFDPRNDDSACYACLYDQGDGNEPEPNTNCSDNGILAPVVGILGSMQALEAIKLISNIGEPLLNRLLIFDALALQWRTVKLEKDSACSVCG